MSVLNLMPHALSQGKPSQIYGELSTVRPAPRQFTDPMFVIIPEWNPDLVFTVSSWPALYGATLPSAGAECLLEFDDQSNLRVTWWNGVYTNPGPSVTDGVTTLVESEILFQGASVSSASAASGITIVGIDAAANVGPLGGDLSGDLPSPTVTGLVGSPLPSGPLASNQGYLWGPGGWGISSLTTTFNGRSGPVLPEAGDYSSGQITNLVTPTAWAPLTLLNGWASSDSTVIGYRKSADGTVMLRGRGWGSVTSGQVAFQLPAGFRPGEDDTYPLVINPNATSSGFVYIDTAGNASVYFWSTGGIYDAGFSGIRFFAEN